MSKRRSISTPQSPYQAMSPQPPEKQEQEALDKIIREASGKPTNVIDKILASTAQPPKTTEEQHSELEDKVIRQCIREYTKGDMYFSYTFGTIIHNSHIVFKLTNQADITRSMQHKREQIAKSHKQYELLAGLGALPSSEASSSINSSAIAEPYPALPLWRRVDKQFWWNEWMSKQFVDAGV
jgi:hypothetical protein